MDTRNPGKLQMEVPFSLSSIPVSGFNSVMTPGAYSIAPSMDLTTYCSSPVVSGGIMGYQDIEQCLAFSFPTVLPCVCLPDYPVDKQKKGCRRCSSGSSTVAIDNKIEQAMDLVKSHLMFAVREEVDVLKEQIRDLVERMSQLEYENGILRAAATPETLALLAQPRQPPAPSSS